MTPFDRWTTRGKPESRVPSTLEIPPWATAVALVIIVTTAAFIRLRLAEVPLERDEGEYAYAGQLMLQGVAPYQLAYNMKLPGTYAVYALIMAVFGESTRAIHLGLVVANSITILLLWLLGRATVGSLCGLVAAASFAVLSLGASVLGLAAHATHFVTLFAVAGTLVLLHARDSARLTVLFSSGILFGLAFLMKQPGIFFGLAAAVVLAGAELLRRPRSWSNSGIRLAVFGAGAAFPFALTCVLLWSAGVFDRFSFWVFSYAREYVTAQPLAEGGLALKTAGIRMVVDAPGVWLLAALGLVALLRWKDQKAVLVLIAFLAASVAAACPGFYFRHHYFIPLLAAAALLVGTAIQFVASVVAAKAGRVTATALAACVFAGAAAHALVHQRAMLFQSSPQQVSRQLYGANPFPESIEIARYIRETSSPSARIAVIGSEPQIYFYSGRRSATGHIYTYGLMEPQPFAETMQREMIAEIEGANPEFLVFVGIAASWLQRPDSRTVIFDWFGRVRREKFQQVGLVEIVAADETVYRWDADAAGATPRPGGYVAIYKRRDSL